MNKYTRKEKVGIEVKNTCQEREHFHQDIELLYVLEGSLEVKIGEKIIAMKAEDIYVVNANKRHSLQGSEDILYAKLMINYQMVSDILNTMNIILWCDSSKSNDERYDQLRGLLKKLLNHYIMVEGRTADFGHIALCYQILELLSVHFLVQTADKISMDENVRFDDRIAQINNYIHANYNQQISMKELSSKLFLSDGYLSRFFKKTYGMSFAEYLTNIRLYHAVDDLIYTDLPITRIVYDNGFSSVTMFDKVFKQAYGETPSAFRRKSSEKRETEDRALDRDAEIRLEKILTNQGLELENAEPGDALTAKASAITRKRMVPVWNRMINIGSAEDILRAEIREHMILLKESLGIVYVRFWNIFSKEMLIDSDQRRDYNFTRVDYVLDFILQHGMKPHIELGPKPRRIHRTVRDALVYPEERVQIHEGRWQAILDAMMRHCILRYGQAEMETWRIEVWRDERTEKNKDSLEQYYRLFNIVYKTVRKYCNFLEVGGCGFRGDYDQEADRDMLIEWAGQECVPDFISMMLYAYIRGGRKIRTYFPGGARIVTL